MLSVAMKKGTGIDDLVRDYVPERVEEKPKAISPVGDRLTPLYQKYRQVLELVEPKYDYYPPLSRKRYLDAELSFVTEVLTPAEVDGFFQSVALFEDRESYPNIIISFLSKLIQNSYHAGYNNFSLHLDGLKPMRYLCCGLRGTPENPLSVSLFGKMERGEHFLPRYLYHSPLSWFPFAAGAKYCTFYFDELEEGDFNSGYFEVDESTFIASHPIAKTDSSGNVTLIKGWYVKKNGRDNHRDKPFIRINVLRYDVTPLQDYPPRSIFSRAMDYLSHSKLAAMVKKAVTHSSKQNESD
ncbi:hypothetical protein HZC30_02445 [Candidatus Woesearchaeota archaeon]|nr:hypothetical protein [Candidatus Woesearchaeota archaeon]